MLLKILQCTGQFPLQSVNSANVEKHFSTIWGTITPILVMGKVRYREANALSLSYSCSDLWIQTQSSCSDPLWLHSLLYLVRKWGGEEQDIHNNFWEINSRLQLQGIFTSFCFACTCNRPFSVPSLGQFFCCSPEALPRGLGSFSNFLRHRGLLPAALLHPGRVRAVSAICPDLLTTLTYFAGETEAESCEGFLGTKYPSLHFPLRRAGLDALWCHL